MIRGTPTSLRGIRIRSVRLVASPCEFRVRPDPAAACYMKHFGIQGTAEKTLLAPLFRLFWRRLLILLPFPPSTEGPSGSDFTCQLYHWRRLRRIVGRRYLLIIAFAVRFFLHGS